MKIVVIGGTGLIGSQVVQLLQSDGHDVVAASPASGVNTLTGEGLDDAVAGAEVVIDVSNSPSFEDEAVLEFFETSTRNQLAAEASAGVRHHVALSIVGTHDLSESGYFRAKLAQEGLIAASPVPFTIVRATQFFEFLPGLADMHTVDGEVRIADAPFQPMASSEVARAVALAAESDPSDAIIEVGGPESFPLAELIGRALQAKGDDRLVIADPGAGYSGAAINGRTLLPGPGATLSPIRYDDWAASAPAEARPPQVPHASHNLPHERPGAFTQTVIYVTGL